MNYIFTTIYPKSKKYFKEFIESLNDQSEKNFQIFLILNNTNLNTHQTNMIKNNYTTFKINTTWQKARIEGLKSLLKKDPKNIIFADSDDILHKDRVKEVTNHIYKYDFVVNNCYLFHTSLQKKKVWLNRRNQNIDLNQIKYKNFVGCSNTVVRGKAIKKILNKINQNLVAFDWCIAKLLLLNKFKGYYMSKPLTFYRQYGENTSSLTKFTKKKIKKDIRCKLEHFKYFEKFGIDYKFQILELEKKNKKIDNKKFLSYVKKRFKIKNQYWWSSV